MSIVVSGRAGISGTYRALRFYQNTGLLDDHTKYPGQGSVPMGGHASGVCSPPAYQIAVISRPHSHYQIAVNTLPDPIQTTRSLIITIGSPEFHCPMSFTRSDRYGQTMITTLGRVYDLVIRSLRSTTPFSLPDRCDLTTPTPFSLPEPTPRS